MSAEMPSAKAGFKKETLGWIRDIINFVIINTIEKFRVHQ
jgi:hypothetical protein